MKLSFSTLGCPRMSFGDIQAIAKDLSYDGIEIRGVMHVIDAPDIREFSPEKREKTMARLKELGLAIPILTSACDLHVPTRWEADFAMAKRYVDTAKAMNIPYVRVLGFNETGRRVLKTAKEKGDLPLVSGGIPKNAAARAYFELENRAADLYTLFAPAGVREDWDRLRGCVPVRI